MKFEIRKLQKTTSTNDEAKKSAAEGGAEGTVIWALEQSAGRGRQGRVWDSPLGNLYFSVILRPEIPQKDYGQYGFIASLALYDALRSFLPKASIELKWPNDVLVEGKKISGILLEVVERVLIVGIGVNVEKIPSNPLYPATSLGIEKKEAVALELVLNKVLAALDIWYSRFHQEGFVPLRTAWLGLARKGSIKVTSPQGEIEGQFEGLENDGTLRLALTDGTVQRITAGDVFFLSDR